MHMQIAQRIIKILKYATMISYKKLTGSPDFTDTVFTATADLGGLFVKFMQLLALRTEIFNDDDKLKLITFYDNVPPDTINLEQILTTELGSDYKKRIQVIDPNPIAAGSFAQVYKASLTDGTVVIIKIKRPNLKLKTTIDFIMLRMFLFIIEVAYPIGIIDLQKSYREFRKFTSKELDYKSEVENALYFYEAYKDSTTVVIPKTYKELSTKRLIVQDFVDGISLTEIIRLKAQHQNYKELVYNSLKTNVKTVLRNLGYELSIQGFKYSRVFTDPHPGNVIVLPNDKVALIDFGLISPIPNNKRNQYKLMEIITTDITNLDTAALGKQVLIFGAEKLYKAILVFDKHIIRSETSIMDVISNNYTKLLDNKRDSFKAIFSQDFARFRSLFFEVMETGEKFNLKVPENWVSVIRASY